MAVAQGSLCPNSDDEDQTSSACGAISKLMSQWSDAPR